MVGERSIKLPRESPMLQVRVLPVSYGTSSRTDMHCMPYPSSGNEVLDGKRFDLRVQIWTVEGREVREMLMVRDRLSE